MGKTVLYIPMEALQCSPEQVIKERKLIQRMESKHERLCVCVKMCVSEYFFLLASVSLRSVYYRLLWSVSVQNKNISLLSRT